MGQVTQVFYDRESDVLYLSVGEPRRALSREIGDDVVLRIDPETDDVVGLTIMNLSSRFGEIDSPQSLPVAIDLHELTNEWTRVLDRARELLDDDKWLRMYESWRVLSEAEYQAMVAEMGWLRAIII